MPRLAGRRPHLALALLAVMIPLASCGTGTAPVPADDAVSHYDDLATELGAALAVDGTPWTLAPDTRQVAGGDDGCRFTPGTWSPETPLPEPSEDEGWTRRMATVNSVLSGYGFEEIEDVTEDGSRTVLQTQDEHGATLSITAEGRIRIWEAAVDTDPCTAETLGIEQS
ncbi:hypothetical protein [Brachybacterium fresconis]|uniref:Uncharacterized protein n=1 Tax=Brachybacterium fresconis TaxID=173363 RepID=A0ABS4YG10_9MICO|nr:hypothetical protein [Brachybacterium fresconis]MBP2407733.1 hypothetical protein [Brachybacterium fresconis]